MEVTPASDAMSAVLYQLVVLVFGAMTSYSIQYIRRMNYANSINLMKLSMTDHLTQIYNRGKLEDELQYQIENAKKHHKPLTIILFDFDNFKIINDTFGHLDGDRLIVEVTDIVRDSIREEDIFARWGGDEFVILLPNKRKENGIALAERLRNRIASNKFKVEVDINSSFGVAELTSGDDGKGFINRADKLLYQAKNEGGNCVKS
jgi:diguanylate cyclase (GGDEF)-like protein